MTRSNVLPCLATLRAFQTTAPQRPQQERHDIQGKIVNATNKTSGDFENSTDMASVAVRVYLMFRTPSDTRSV